VELVTPESLSLFLKPYMLAEAMAVGRAREYLHIVSFTTISASIKP